MDPVTDRDINQATRIGKLLRLAISTDKNPEALSALAAIKRSIGPDAPHIIGDLIERHWNDSAPTEAEIIELRPWQRIALDLLDNGELWGSREKYFLTVIAGMRAEPSARQWRWLTDIKARRAA
jgi:hypothetical protein